MLLVTLRRRKSPPTRRISSLGKTGRFWPHAWLTSSPSTRQSTTMGYVLPAVIKGVLSGEISWDTLGQRPPEDTCCPGRRPSKLYRGVGCEPAHGTLRGLTLSS